MSRPMLPDHKHSSWSREKSPAWNKQRPMDEQYGHSSVQSENRSRSRSRGRSKGDQDRSWYGADPQNRGGEQMFHGKQGRNGGARNSRERQRQRKRGSRNSSCSSASSSSSGRREMKAGNQKYHNARLFVANIVSKDVTDEELHRHFEIYGHIVDVFIHTKNFAFIQYTKEEHALLAIEGEQDRTLKGWKLDVKMACEDRSRVVGFGGRGGRGDSRGGRGGRGGGGGGGRFDSSERDRSPLRDDRIRDRDPYMEPFRGGGPRLPFPPGGDFGLRERDPYMPDPFRRGFQDPWMSEDPYRRDPYADPYRDPYRQRAPPPPVIECEIFVHSAQFRAYGDAIERRVKENNIITAVSVMPEGRTPQQLVEDLTAQSCLFAIFINPQNEMHRSLTLNILHGTPQEHRNMPLDDAIALVGRSFIKYVEGLRDKAEAAAAPLPPSSSNRIFLPPSLEVNYLLNLLADNRALTVAELDTVIKYLQERRGKLADAESRPIFTDETSFGKAPAPQRSDHVQAPIQENPSANMKDPTSSQQDLTNRILSLFSNAGGNIQGVPPANGTQQSSVPKLPSGTPAPPPPQAPVASNASLINFDNPNVQKALDNLIQSSPHLLKNINTKAPLSTSQMGSVSGTMGAQGNVSGNMGAQGSASGNMGAQGNMSGNMGAQGNMSGNMGAQGNMSGNMGAQGNMSGNMGAQGNMSSNMGAQGNMSGNMGAQGSASGNMGAQGSGMYGQVGGQMHNQSHIQAGYGAALGQMMQSLGQAIHGSNSPSLQGMYNMPGQGLQEHMQQGYGQPSQSRY